MLTPQLIADTLNAAGITTPEKLAAFIQDAQAIGQMPVMDWTSDGPPLSLAETARLPRKSRAEMEAEFLADLAKHRGEYEIANDTRFGGTGK
jgi:hypothetical protein